MAREREIRNNIFFFLSTFFLLASQHFRELKKECKGQTTKIAIECGCAMRSLMSSCHRDCIEIWNKNEREFVSFSFLQFIEFRPIDGKIFNLKIVSCGSECALTQIQAKEKWFNCTTRNTIDGIDERRDAKSEWALSVQRLEFFFPFLFMLVSFSLLVFFSISWM